MGNMLNAIARRFVKTLPLSDMTLRGTVNQSIAVAQMEGANLEAARSGNRFMGGTLLAANGVAADTAVPTTTAKLVLFNGAADGGKCIFLDLVTYTLISGTAAAGSTLCIAVTQQKLATAPAGGQATGYTVQSASGSTKASIARWAASQTLPLRPLDGANPFYCPIIGNNQSAAANFAMGNNWARLQGGIVIPPGFAASFCVLTGAGTSPLYAIGAIWDELDTDLE